MLLFISDMHLQEERPELSRAFLHFLATQAVKAEAVYLLGDIFNYWVGDDAMTAYHQQIAAGLKSVADHGTQVFIMHGNRDFALGAEFCRQAGCTLLPDPSVINPYGQPILLMHGDSLCTQDVGYQVLRAILRNPLVTWVLQRLPVRLRQKLGRKARQVSQANKGKKASYLVDVTPAAVVKQLQKHACSLLIHGHTHQPAVHSVPIKLQGQSLMAQRYVLGDWSDSKGWKLELNAAGATLQEFDFNAAAN